MKDLKDVYTDRVQGKQAGGIPSLGSSPPPIFERDPNLRILEQNVFSQLQKIVEPEITQQSSDIPVSQFVSFEDALKELSQMTHK
jgi:hypothetical protein